MGDQRSGGIAWTDETWNPLRGCSRVSEGCRHCYAEVVAARFSGPGQAYEGLAKRTPSGARWTGEVRLVEAHLDDPIRWQRPRRVFVNSMSDLFHEAVTDATLDRIFAVMFQAEQHVYQILTKRPARMRDYVRRMLGSVLTPAILSQIWLGVSVEDQATADERIPLLLETPAAVRWVSYEPALGSVAFAKWLPIRSEVPTFNGDPIRWLRETEVPWVANRTGLGWIVVGGESGLGARPFDLAWARATVAQGRAAGVPVFVKQLGAKPTIHETYPNGERTGKRLMLDLHDRKGGDMAEWPPDLRVREFPR